MIRMLNTLKQPGTTIAHTESSMTGEESCPPPKESVAKEPQAEPAAAASVGGLLSFQPNSVLQGVLFAEILGKPKSQR